MSNYKDYLKMKWIYPKMTEKHPELKKAGKVEKCYKILAPIITAEVDILQKPIESFEEIEKLILRLIGASVKDKNELAKLTGIPVNYIENMISIFITQKLLKEDGTTLTENGIISLQTGEKHIVTTEKRKIQINGITGNVMPKKFQIYENELLKIQDIHQRELYQIPAYEQMQVVEDSLWEEMKENVEQYVYIYNETSTSNVEKISISQIIDHSYTYFFLLKYENLKQPILIAKSKLYKNEKMEFYYEPLWIYKEDANYLGIKEKEIIGKSKQNMINFENRIQQMYLLKEENVIKFLEKWHVKRVEDSNTYEVKLNGNEYDKNLLFQMQYISYPKASIPCFPEDNEKLNGEVFYFYTKDGKKYEEMQEIAKVICLYMKKVKEKYQSAKDENCKKDNPDITEKMINELVDISKEKIEKYLKEFKNL